MNTRIALAAFSIAIAHVGGAQVDPWQKETPYPGVPRSGTATFTLGTRIHVVCGNTGIAPTPLLTDHWAYDTADSTWDSLAPFPGSARYFATGFSIGDTGYVCCGTDDGQDSLGNKNDLWRYDAVNDSWQQRASLNGAPRCQAVAFTIDGIAYVGSGTTGTPSGPTGNVGDFHAYDPSTNSWISVASISSARRSASAFTIDGIGYVGMGTTDDLTPTMQRNDLWAYDPDADQWNQRAHLPGGARAQAGSFAMRGFGFVIGGRQGVGYASDLWVYNPCANLWAEDPTTSFTPTRADLVCGSVNDTAYVGLGDDSTFPDDMWSYAPQFSHLTLDADPVISCCANGLLLDGSNTIAATEVPGANKYQFRFVNVPGQPAYTRQIAFGTRSFTLRKWAQVPLKPGRTYITTVRVSFDGGNTWGAFGPACTVRISGAAFAPASEERSLNDARDLGPDPLLYPNPLQDRTVFIRTPGEAITTPIDLTLLDVFGRVVQLERLGPTTGDVRFKLDAAVPSGTYIVIISSGVERWVERLIVDQ